MEAALFYEFLHPQSSPLPNPLQHQAKSEQQLFTEVLEQVSLAEQVGFHSVWSMDHHIMPGHSHQPAPEMFFAAASQRTKTIRFGTAVTVLPATGASGSDCRAYRGPGPFDRRARGVRHWPGWASAGLRCDGSSFCREPGAEESLDLIVTALTTREFTFSGRFFHVTEPTTIAPMSLQQPHPPVWVATLGPETPSIIGRKGISMLTFSFFQPLESFADGIKKFRQAAVAAGRDPDTLKIGAAIPLHVAETSKQARADAEELLLWYMKSSIEVVKPVLKKDVPGNLKYLEQLFGLKLDQLTYDDLLSANRIICGSPAGVHRTAQTLCRIGSGSGSGHV
jgi:alkanesulfonate monooxygenase SsuD/methylene tetrahydromethanopterin reductase-like flavin-dependent oxidoreductase (luciferase family)